MYSLQILVVATYPIYTIVVSLVIAEHISYGAFDLPVTTNPIEIWAAPESRCRKEKDYFDKTFTPFYRTEQIFFKIIGIDNVRKINTLLYT